MEDNNFDEEFYFDTSTNDEEFEQCFQEYVRAILPHKFSINEMNEKAEECAKTHDAHLKECLILTNLDLVSQTAKNIGNFFKVDEEDLLPQIYLNLVELVDKYGKTEEDIKTPFSIFIYQGIRKKIFSYVAKQSGMRADTVQHIWKDKTTIKNRKGFDPTIEEVIDDVIEYWEGWEPNYIRDALAWINQSNKQSLDELNDNGLDLLSNVNIEEIFYNDDLKEKLEILLNKLSPKEEFVIRSRFGLPYPKQIKLKVFENRYSNIRKEYYPDVSDEDRKFTATPKTGPEIAEYLDISESRVYQLEHNGIRKMRFSKLLEDESFRKRRWSKSINPHKNYSSEQTDNILEQTHSIVSKSDDGITQVSDPYEDIEVLDLDYNGNSYDSEFEGNSHHYR